MTQRTLITLEHSQPWQAALQNLITEPSDLLKLVELRPEWLPAANAAAKLFPLKVTHSFASRIRKGDPNDPLLLQVLPLHQEHESPPEYSKDPLEEARFNPVPGLIHKYHGRVLLIAASHCAIHCRYCFRRHFAYEDNRPSRAEWGNALAYIREHKEIHEVILSGGDPLALGDSQLKWLIEHITDIPHVQTLRLHTRLPVILPSRINHDLIKALSDSRLNTVCVIHSNHAQELDESVRIALARMKEANIHLLNQSVLLSGINDSALALVTLSHRLFEFGVMPYYLHALDLVYGAAHFNVDITRANRLLNEARSQLPGYLMPKWVRETPTESSKTPLSY